MSDLIEASVTRDFYRYLLDGNTLNYNRFGNDAYISDIDEENNRYKGLISLI